MADTNTPLPKKNPFAKFFGDAPAAPSAVSGDSLVESIVREAERQAAEQKSGVPQPAPEHEGDVTALDQAHAHVRRARHVLTGTVVLSALSWLFFYAALDENNHVLGLIHQDNLSTQIAHQTDLSTQLTAQDTSVQMGSTLMKLETAANSLLKINLHSSDLTFSRATDVVSVAGGYRMAGNSGELISLTEDQVQSMDARAQSAQKELKVTIASLQSDLKDMQAALSQLTGPIKTDYQAFAAAVKDIDTTKAAFPTSADINSITQAQALANPLMKDLKGKTLQGLRKDIQDEVATMQLQTDDTASQAVITQVSDALKGLSPTNPQSFDRVQKQVAALPLSTLTDQALFQRLTALFVSSSAHKSELSRIGLIANNLGRSNTILELGGNRISWSTVMGNVQKISRLGADELPDDGATYTDARKDLDTQGTQIQITGYEGKTDKGEIDLHGTMAGSGTYADKNFTLLSDFIDALEGSTAFQDVQGFAFSKSRTVTGAYTTPMNLTLTIQKPGEKSDKDIPAKTPDAPKPAATTAAPATPAAAPALPATPAAPAATPVPAVPAAPDTTAPVAPAATSDTPASTPAPRIPRAQ